jgi:tetratricopeptide (TPR) repeat protein
MKRSLLLSISLLLIFTVAFITYSNHFNNAFHFDDEHTIVHNQHIKNIKNIPSFFLDAGTTSALPANQAYRPGLTALNTIDLFFSANDVPLPFAYHVSIFISFLLLSILIYFFVLHILSLTIQSTWNYFPTLFITAWFLLHTANAETINYIIARSDSFSTLMIVTAFIVYIYVPSTRKNYLYLLPVIVGFFVKEQTIMFVPILFIYKLLFEEKLALADLWKKRINVFSSFKRLIIPFLICIALYALSRAMTPPKWTSGETQQLRYIATQPFVILHYVYNFILPVNLVVDTDWKLVTSFYDDKVFAGILFLIALAYGAFKASRYENYKGVAFGICWFILALLPTSLFPFSEVLNDHRPFFPYIGLFIAVANLLQNIVVNLRFQQSSVAKNAFFCAAFLVLALHAYGTYERNRIWHTEESLWQDATLKAPRNPKAWMNYGIALMARGDYQGAENCYTKTKELSPYYPYVYINLGIVKHATGRLPEAEEEFKKALSLDANIPEAYSFYANYLLHTNRLAEAQSIVNKGLEISPAHLLLNELNVQLQAPIAIVQPASKIQSATATVMKAPTPANYLDLSLEYYNAGKYDSCIVAAQEALKKNPAYDLAYNNMCAAYNRLKNWNKAIEAGEKGLKINPENKLLKANLSVSYQESTIQKSAINK